MKSCSVYGISWELLKLIHFPGFLILLFAVFLFLVLTARVFMQTLSVYLRSGTRVLFSSVQFKIKSIFCFLLF